MSEVEVLTAREVPLGGLRAMRVRRTLPQRHRSLIGAWCFVDHYGPDRVSDTAVLHGAQLWIALPEASRDTEPRFAHHVPSPVTGSGWEARVFLGSLLGDTSPVATFTPLLGAELVLEAGAVLDLEVDETFEHGVLVDTGVVEVGVQETKPGELAFVASGQASLRLSAGVEPARVLLLGGTPLGEPIVMWWNFVGRSHDEIVDYRDTWQAWVEGGERGRFGVVDQPMPSIPAPPLPNARLKQRR